MSAVVQATPLRQTTLPPLPKGDACTLVIFGATGDLTSRKLMPALYDLACIGCTNNEFEVLGIGRTEMSDDQFREKMREAVSSSRDARDFTPEDWERFAKRLHYIVGDPNQGSFYPQLSAKLDELEKNGSSPNHLFYVSVPASIAPPIVEGLGDAGLAKNEKGWTRIVLEKPFGRDLKSAHELNEIVARVFEEPSVYRIDHYLGKETVQNILVFRFGNSLFEPVWNRNYIDFVEITAAETLGVESRAAFYEETGALRDMVANHLLQLVTLTAMEPPVAFDADSVREQKVQVLRSIRPMTVAEVAHRTVRGQYGPGTVNGKIGARLPPGTGSEARLKNRNLRGCRISHPQLALGGSSLLRPHWKTFGRVRDRSTRSLQTDTSGLVRTRQWRQDRIQHHLATYSAERRHRDDVRSKTPRNANAGEHRADGLLLPVSVRIANACCLRNSVTRCDAW